MSEHEHEKIPDKEAIDQNGFTGEGHDEEVGIVHKGDPLQRDLQSRHMQMIAIGVSLSLFLTLSLSLLTPRTPSPVTPSPG